VGLFPLLGRGGRASLLFVELRCQVEQLLDGADVIVATVAEVLHVPALEREFLLLVPQPWGSPMYMSKRLRSRRMTSNSSSRLLISITPLPGDESCSLWLMACSPPPFQSESPAVRDTRKIFGESHPGWAGIGVMNGVPDPDHDMIAGMGEGLVGSVQHLEDRTVPLAADGE
jgi:hypothetical protein